MHGSWHDATQAPKHEQLCPHLTIPEWSPPTWLLLTQCHWTTAHHHLLSWSLCRQSHCMHTHAHAAHPRVSHTHHRETKMTSATVSATATNLMDPLVVPAAVAITTKPDAAAAVEPVDSVRNPDAPAHSTKIYQNMYMHTEPQHTSFANQSRTNR